MTNTSTECSSRDVWNTMSRTTDDVNDENLKLISLIFSASRNDQDKKFWHLTAFDLLWGNTEANATLHCLAGSVALVFCTRDRLRPFLNGSVFPWNQQLFFSQLGFGHRPRRLKHLWAHHPSPLPSRCALQASHGIACCHMLQSLALVLVFVFFWCFMLTWFFSRSFIWRRQSRQENWRINTSRTFLPFKRYFSNVTVLQNTWKQSNSELQAWNVYMTVYLHDSVWRW